PTELIPDWSDRMAKPGLWLCTCPLAVAALLTVAPPVQAQTDPPPAAPVASVAQDADRVSAPSSSAEPAIPSIRGPFGDIVTDFRRLPSRQTLGWLGVGATAALFSHAEDKAVMRGFAPTASLNTTFGAGDTIGSTPFQLGAAVATYSIGRLTNSPRA